MKLTLVLIFAAALQSDTITYTSEITTALQYCDGGCDPFSLHVPRFDPTLGALQSVTWSFVDYQTFYQGVNDLYQPVGIPYTWSETEGAASALLGFNASNTQYYAGVTCSCRQVSHGGFFLGDQLAAVGQIAVGDTDQFVGGPFGGDIFISVLPSISATWPVVEGDAATVASAITELTDQASLTVTYEYSAGALGADSLVSAPSAAVPEPASPALFLLGALTVLVCLRKL